MESGWLELNVSEKTKWSRSERKIHVGCGRTARAELFEGFGSTVDGNHEAEAEQAVAIAIVRALPFELAVALGKEIVSAVYRCNAVLENALPLVLDTLDLIVKAEYHIVVVTIGAAVGVFVIRVI